jgi:cell division protein FtsB
MKISVKTIVSVLLFFVVLTLAALLVFGQRGIAHLVTLQEQFAALEAENQRILRDNERLQHEIELLNDNLAYIEDIARKQLGLVKRDELVYQLQPHNTAQPGSDRR